jgi:hypothetical protein
VIRIVRLIRFIDSAAANLGADATYFRMTAPVAFISYSHDSRDHKAWVLRLAGDLRTRGIDAILDQWRLAPGQDVAAFMETSIARADRVLLICSHTYVEKADAGTGGVGYEKLVVTGELVARIDTKKFIPIVRQADVHPRRLPHFLGARMYIDFSDDAEYETRLEELLRELHGWALSPEPPVGANPFAGTPPTESPPARQVSISGATSSGRPVTEESWFNSQYASAEIGMSSLGLKAGMEIRSALHDPVAKSQIELLNAVRKAEIRTFGWPIGIVMENVDDYRPRPVADGIVAKVAIPEKSISGTPSYDYWYARNNGDFYLLQSLFEDQRTTDAIFFDTRIVRVTEALLFLSRFYENLGTPLEARVTVGITHRGLADRTLTSAGNRHVFPRKTTAGTSITQVSDTVLGLRERTTNHVMQILEPMFMLFDFATFDRSIYQDIVSKFAAGHVA